MSQKNINFGATKIRLNKFDLKKWLLILLLL